VTCLVNEGKTVGIVYLGFSKAFDTVSHSILLKKPAAQGLHWCNLCWIKYWAEVLMYSRVERLYRGIWTDWIDGPRPFV